MNQDDLLARLAGIEWSDFECKRAYGSVPEDAYKTVSAFANTAGGWLVFGVSETGGRFEVTGVKDPDRTQNDFLSALRGGQKLNRVIAVEPQRYEIDGKHVFAFHVPEMPRGEKPVYLRGDPRQSYIRRGAGDERCLPNELERFLRDAGQERYDGAVLAEIPVDSCFDLETVRWYQALFHGRTPEHTEIADPIEFLVNWNFAVERDGKVSPTRASVLMFGTGRYVRQVLPRPVLDYQRIDAPFEQWSADQRWHDRYVFEDNLFRTWQGLVARYMRIAEHPFALDAGTLRRNDDPPDYVAFREAAINLLIHQDYGDHGRKASIKLFTDRTVFWNPGDAFGTDAELLDPTEKEVRNPSIVTAFRRIGLSDQAGTGIRAIFRNWHQLGRMPPRIINDKARKDFELELVNEPLVSDAMARFRDALGVNLELEQADALALALSLPRDQPLTLTAIRGVDFVTTSQAKRIADHLVGQGLLEALNPTHFRVPEPIRQLFTDATAATLAGPGTRPDSRPESQPELLEMRVLKILADTHASKSQLSALLGQREISGQLNKVVRQLLENELIAYTIPDKPRSRLQRYRLTDLGRARLSGEGE